MSALSPFAYGHQGYLLTSTQDHELFVCGADDEAPLFIHAMDARVAGVRHVEDGVLAVDDHGQLCLLSAPGGELRWSLPTSVRPLGLAATASGRWAVIHDQGAVIGRGEAIEGSVDASDVVAGAFGEGDTKLGLATSTGTLIVADAEGGAGRRVELGASANGIAWSALGWWLVSTSEGVYRWAPDEEAAVLYLKWAGDGAPQRVAASADGRLCAFVSEEKYVIVFGVEYDINGGALVYFDREAQELEFGPGNLLGVGLGLGDGNKVDLLTGDVCRTDPPEGRERNRWMIKVGLDFADIRRALGLPALEEPDESSGAAESEGDDEEGMSGAMKLLVLAAVAIGGVVVLRMLLALGS